MVTMLCGKLKLLFLHVHFVPGGKVSYQLLWLPGSMVNCFHGHLTSGIVNYCYGYLAMWQTVTMLTMWYDKMLLWLPGGMVNCSVRGAV